MTKIKQFVQKYDTICSVLLSFIGVFGIVYYALRIRENILAISNSVIALLLFCLLIPVFKKSIQYMTRRLLGFSLVTGMLLSLMLVWGAEIYVKDSVQIFDFKKWIGVILVGAVFTALTALLFVKIPVAVSKINSIGSKNLKDKYFNGNLRYFIIISIIILVCWIPALLASYPGVFGYDSIYQLYSMGPGGTLTSDHPILHTFYLYGCITFGQSVLGSEAKGLLVYSITQMLMMAAAFGYTCRFIAKRGAPVLIQLLIIVFFALWPVNAIFSVSVTKDVLYAAALLLLVLFTIDMIQDKAGFFSSWKRMLRYVVTAFLMMALRNNGIYMLFVFTPFLVIGLRKYWKRAALICIACILSYMVYTGPVYNMLHVSPGNIREAMSTPIQQLARAANYSRGDLTDEEYKQICYYIPEEYLSEYRSAISDPVKRRFITSRFKEDSAAFIKLWINVGIKCPGVYLDAFLANNYGYWYPDMVYPDPPAWHPYIEFKNSPPRDGFLFIEEDAKFPMLQKFYQLIGYNGAHQYAPAISMFFSPGFAFWMLFMCMMLFLYYKKYDKLMPPLLLFLLWGTLLLSPVVLLRYAYPIFLGVAVLLFMVFSEKDFIIPRKNRLKKGKKTRRNLRSIAGPSAEG